MTKALKKVYFNVEIYETLDGDDDDRWCPECNNELHYTERDGHIYCIYCDYEKWED